MSLITLITQLRFSLSAAGSPDWVNAIAASRTTLKGDSVLLL
ncbi:hypothetical protein [Dendronalium sp. ChiSLP03b]|nr:hypothetical protein [Dendronalium sp. ChiSLP03b]